MKRNKQKLLAVASGQNASWNSGGFNDPGPKPKYPRLCPGIEYFHVLYLCHYLTIPIPLSHTIPYRLYQWGIFCSFKKILKAQL
jgi:hypothetical protein